MDTTQEIRMDETLQWAYNTIQRAAIQRANQPPTLTNLVAIKKHMNGSLPLYRDVIAELLAEPILYRSNPSLRALAVKMANNARATIAGYRANIADYHKSKRILCNPCEDALSIDREDSIPPEAIDQLNQSIEKDFELEKDLELDLRDLERSVDELYADLIMGV